MSVFLLPLPTKYVLSASPIDLVKISQIVPVLSFSTATPEVFATPISPWGVEGGS